MSILLEFARWLGSTEGSIALHESNYMWLIVESLHVLFLCVFVGFTAAWDLRLLGIILRGMPVSEVYDSVRPWMMGGFIVMAITGGLLVYSNPVRNFQNIFFRVKVVLLVLAGINVFVFNSGVYRRIVQWDRTPVPPKRARIAGAVSLTLWGLIIVMGRLIAYNWFDKLFQ
jgi:hypothetical protein